MHRNTDRINLNQYLVQDQSISPFVRKMVYHTPAGKGELFSLEPYPGVQLWTFDFDVQGIDFSALENNRSLMLNYCFLGRCEMQLPDNRYVYVNSNVLSVDTSPPFGRTIIPIGTYKGIEITINLDLMEQSPPASWKDCGIELKVLLASLKRTHGSYLARVTPEYDRKIRLLGEHINQADWPLAAYRYYLLCLLWELQNESPDQVLYHPVFLTTGQRAAVARTQNILTKDLSRRFVITDLARAEGISAATLKKNFALVYGKPISVFLKEQRVEKAKELLTQSTQSIEEIASRVGYENQGKFSVMFRKETSVTPMEYRRLHKQPHLPSGPIDSYIEKF